MENFTPLYSTLGGALIGLAAASMLAFNGRIAGISGITGGILRPLSGDIAWRVAFLLGLLAGGFGMYLQQPELFAMTIERSSWALAAAGVLVGVGTQMGSGCTSGHGVCGISRFSKRSMAATGTFMLTGAIAVFVVNHLLGGAL